MWCPRGCSEKARESGTWSQGAVLALLLALLTSAVLLAGPLTTVGAAGIEEVTRAAPGTPAPGAEFEVTLQLPGELPLVVGIIETLPAGFKFVSTSCEHYEVAGQRLLLAVINETEVRYTVKAPSSGAGTFSGTWADMLSEREGLITDTLVSVGGTGGDAIGKGSPTPSGTAAAPSAAPEVPGFETIFAALSLLVVTLLMIIALKGGRDT